MNSPYINQILVLILFLSACNSNNQNSKTNSNYRDQIIAYSNVDSFINVLHAAVEQKNITLLHTLFADTILESNDGCPAPGCSKADFFEMYFKDTTSNDWSILDAAIKLGFQRNDTSIYATKTNIESYEAPKNSWNFNPLKEVVIIVSKTYLFSDPKSNASIIDSMKQFEKLACACDYDIGPVIIEEDNKEWLNVHSKAGIQGYVLVTNTTMLLEKKIILQQINNEWKIVSYYTNINC